MSCITSVGSNGGTYYADLIGAISTNSNSATTTTAITSSHRFQGDIGEIRIWSVARTAAQIADNMNTQLVGTESGLEALFTFATDTGADSSTCADQTGSYSGNYVGSCAIVDRLVS